jgi:hypothetical protein
MRLGLAVFDFQRGGIDAFSLASIPLTARFAPVLNEVRMYSTALRQLDPLSEFLHYYRVLESIDARARGVSMSNAKAWVRANLPNLATFDFGRLEVRPDVGGTPRRCNVFKVYQQRALKRVAALRQRLTQPIEDYLYHEMRCGIAHGVSNTKTFDFGGTVEDVGRDLYVVKMLARLAIDRNATAAVIAEIHRPHIEARRREEVRALAESLRRERASV